MSINELKAMSEKELCIWSSKVNTKELKAILKENGFKGYSKLKKAELLDIVLDMVIFDEVEVEVANNEENNINNVPDTMIINEVEDINIKQDIEKGLKSTLSFESSFGSLFPNRRKKSKEEYIIEEIRGQKVKHEGKIRNAKENKDLNKVANELNECFSQLGSGLKAQVITTNNRSCIRNSLYIYAKGVCIECNEVDFYLTKLDKLISKDDDQDWFNDIYEGVSQRDICKEENKLDILYVFGSDGDIVELPLYVEPLEGNLIEYRINLLNDKNVDVDMCMKDWFDVSSKSGWIYYGIEVDEFLAINRAKKGQEINFRYMTEKAMNDLYNKTNVALGEINDIKLLK